MTDNEVERLAELEEENEKLLERLSFCADLLVETGKLPNTPQAKLDWMLGIREATK